MKKITAIGEILFDVYPEGKTLGGAPFNFIYHVIRLTGQGSFVSRIGNDDLGNEIKQSLKEKGIPDKFIQVDNSHKTGTARPTLNDAKIPTWIIEQNTAYDFIENEKNLNKLIESNTDCLYFGTLAQREPKSRRTIQSLLNKDKKYFCDLNIRQNFYTKEVIEASIQAADVLKLNIDELKLLNEIFIRQDFNENKLAGKIIKDCNIDLLCITKGNGGAALYTQTGVNHCAVGVKNVVDTVGAGDAYAAILCIGYLNNWDLKRINRTAAEFAAEIVKVQGALPTDDLVYEKYREDIGNV
jgi:fructokinase